MFLWWWTCKQNLAWTSWPLGWHVNTTLYTMSPPIRKAWEHFYTHRTFKINIEPLFSANKKGLLVTWGSGLHSMTCRPHQTRMPPAGRWIEALWRTGNKGRCESSFLWRNFTHTAMRVQHGPLCSQSHCKSRTPRVLVTSKKKQLYRKLCEILKGNVF